MQRQPRSNYSRLPGLFALAGLAVLSACGGGNGNDDNGGGQAAPAVAATTAGQVQAVDRLGMRSYFGIPFAAPPVGNMRWLPPAAAQPWTAPLAKTQSNAPCLQTSSSAFRLPNGQEDCLYLDVHAPASGAGPFPVMVWIHGGAFNTGGTVTYADPSPLVGKGVIVVNIAYRMGAMGFLGHPSLRAADGSVGNYGIMDQQAALRWVQDNIASFGGNRANVTIFGESAGGFSVMTHLASPLSKGLFSKAIVESGGYGFDRQLTQAQLETQSTAVVNSALAAAGVACATVDAACLRGLPADVVNNQLAAAFTAANSSPVPSVDGKVLPKTIKNTFIAGENNKVPLVNGSNRDEWSLFVASRELLAGPLTAAQYPSYLQTSLGLPPTLAAFYPLADYGTNPAQQPSLGATAAGTDLLFSCPGLNASKRVLAQGSPIYMYEFRDRTAIPSIGRNTVSFNQGAGHSYELQYLFNLRDLETAEHRDLQTAMSRYWTNFARTGNPNEGDQVAVSWPAFSGPSKVLGLDVGSAGGIRELNTFEADHKCNTAWAALTF
ncbi:carboxylesterase/lipase family protein [Noviherbaspirillum suwonense]|uniref:Carboxylic ester hydrolase n=1 Tax=Noviherbaspirillum suwonense TaxID=1224511 RepID=A0ABY1PXS5_9BURK|nr:carboxylesterase family protein [Noviherbaspirillum suwonense]SMP49164.1 para-nitrobenzyl esterase [Noviherbaspirillum suwonense]